MIDSQYMIFEDVTPKGRKTKVVLIKSKKNDSVLGSISWYGAWRQYVLTTSTRITIFNKGCMNDIIAVIDKLMDERKQC